MSHGLLVTGTDTGVGKTFVAAGLVRLLLSRGVGTGVMKPAETGHDFAASGTWPSDARTLAMAAACLDPVDVVCPYVFEEPLAPIVAARRSGRTLEIERIADCYERLCARHDFVVVEGAGGISVPLGEFGPDDRLFDYADLARLLDVPLLVVARAHLGTLNHTFLTVHYARSRGLRTMGIVLNGLDLHRADPSIADNASVAEEMCQVPVLGTIDRVEGVVDVNVMAEACARAIDVDRVITMLREAGHLPPESTPDTERAGGDA